MNPPQQQQLPLAIWKVTLTDGGQDSITAVGYNILPDGSIIFGDQFGALVAYHSREWSKVDRSSIQPAGRS